MIHTLLLAAILIGGGLVLSAGLWWVAERGRRGRQEIDLRIHQRTLSLDLRFDALEERLDRLEVGQKISHLHHLLAVAESTQRLGTPACDRFRRHLLDLEQDARVEGKQ